ncbi:ferrous iron transport protein B [Hydrogenivirga sp. 128-5-R1-1]|uniref:ferrous iron transport protein B n=1 Tax=Hydrogenivirga sp. 128-5-R1-1 TaxID=392423 RepID=UPI00015F0CD0|nr:ferrous iron transport protein B [Hydrogenivirga sp. 128-5-R1-1]EDP75961.1 ferrous iron transport protein B [Hydrogenivirga sp. 128-5-R1-1]
MKKVIKVAVAGNPNVGKTTILNQLAGTSLKVGNWPGVTVEKKEAVVKFNDYEIHFIDLPGIYTLEPISEDERIAVHFLEEEKPDVILNIIETPNIERNLLLTAELLEFGVPMVVVLNMIDEANRLGIEVDDRRMEELLGAKVIKTIGRTGVGVKDILPAVVSAYESNAIPKPIVYGDVLEEGLNSVYERITNKDVNKHDLIKYITEGEEFSDIKKELEEKAGKKVHDLISDERYAFAHGLFAEVVKKKGVSARDITDAVDRIVLHPYLGFVIFIGVIYLVFKFSFDFASPFVDWIDGFINDFLAPLSYSALNALGLPEWFLRFFAEAVVGGVGFVLTFVPLIASLYFFITFLEMSGYIPRVAFLMDRFMHRIGLHGKSVIPLILGFGCNVPAIVATRTMESTRDKLLVIMMIPFMSCPARLVVFAFFVSIFFKNNPALVITFLYLLGILVALLTGFLLRKTAYKGSMIHFVMELPPYRLPSLKSVLTIIWVHVRDFLYRAGTLIFGASILIWLLLNLPPGVKNPADSVAGGIGKALVPIFEPMGIDNWKATTSLIPAFLAREIVISSMGTIYTSAEGIEPKEEEDFKFSEALKDQVLGLGLAFKDAVSSMLTLSITSLQVEEEGEDTLRELIRKDFTPASAMAFMVFILIYTSCLGTYAVMVREIGKIRATLFLGYSFVMAWFMGFVVYRVMMVF